MGEHLIDGEFQSDKYPSTPRGKVPLSVKDPMAQDLLWEYARRRRVVDTEFSDDLEEALKLQGSAPREAGAVSGWREDATSLLNELSGFLDAMLHTEGIEDYSPVESLKQRVDALVSSPADAVSEAMVIQHMTKVLYDTTRPKWFALLTDKPNDIHMQNCHALATQLYEVARAALAAERSEGET